MFWTNRDGSLWGHYIYNVALKIMSPKRTVPVGPKQKKGAKDKMEKRVIKFSLVGAILTILIIITLIVVGVVVTKKIYNDKQNEASITIETDKGKNRN